MFAIACLMTEIWYINAKTAIFLICTPWYLTMNITVSDLYRNISLTQCLNLIVQNYTNQTDLVSVYSEYGGLEFAYKQMDYSKKVLSKFNPRKPRMYLFENVKEDKMRNFLKGLKHQNVSFNARARYIFVQDEFHEKFLRLAMRYFLVNAIFLNSHSGEIRTYFPYKTRSLNTILTGLVQIGSCRHGEVHLVDNYTNLFPTKIPSTWRNSTIRVMHHHHKVFSMCGKCKEQGIEIEIFDTISKGIGVTAVFYRVDTPPLAWRLFHEDVFDLFLINFIPLTFTDFTMSYIREVYYWFVPFPGITPRWSNILTVFPLNVWLCVSLTAVFISVMWVINSLMKGKRIIPQLLKIIGYIVSLFLEQSRNVTPPKWIHEVLLFKALILTFFMNIFFKSRLTYLLNGINYEKSIGSLEEAVELGMYIGSIRDYVRMFNTSERMARYLEDKLVLCDFDSLECANRTAFVRDFISMQSATKIVDAKPIFFNEKAGHWLLKPLSPPMHIKPIVASFPLGFPMFPLYNKNLYRLVECGIVDKISKHYYDEKVLKTSDPLLAATQSLNLDHVVAPGFIWITGVLLSILLFILEKNRWMDAFHRKKNR